MVKFLTVDDFVSWIDLDVMGSVLEVKLLHVIF